jgi:hypothetical protein
MSPLTLSSRGLSPCNNEPWMMRLSILNFGLVDVVLLLRSCPDQALRNSSHFPYDLHRSTLASS